jgi:hypothetical protein
LSNAIINFSHNLEELMSEMKSGIIDPFEEFADNYYTINQALY